MKTLAVRRGVLALGLAAAFAAAPALAADKNPVVATVNGASIHLSDVAEFQQSLPPQMGRLPFQALLQSMIRARLVSDAARKEGMEHDPAVKRAVKEAEEAAMRQAWMQKKVKSEITEASMKARYDDLIAKFKPEDEVHARHILVESEDQAKAIIGDLKAGASFEDMAKAKSTDKESAKNGGDLGFFTRSEMVKPFADAAFALQAGEVSPQPVHTQFGWHVIKVEEHRQTTPPTFEQAKPVLFEQMGSELAQKLVADLEAKAKVKTFNPDGSPVAEPAAPAAK